MLTLIYSLNLLLKVVVFFFFSILLLRFNSSCFSDVEEFYGLCDPGKLCFDTDLP